MDVRIPPKLRTGDTVRVVAPSCSLAMISPGVRAIADYRLRALGLEVSFGKHVEESDQFTSSPVESRVEDLHEALADPDVAGILTAIGGYNSNQLLRRLDWDLISRNPKALCGFSDITALGNAILAKTGIVTYSGPHYSTFGQKRHAEYTVEYFVACLMSDAPYTVRPSPFWTDDAWYLGQDNRILEPGEGYRVIHEGEAEGKIVGGNLSTLNLLQGTEFLPNLAGSILFLEDDFESQPHTFDRDLQSFLQLPGFAGVQALVIGRFQRESHMTDDLLRTIIATKPELARLPVIANVDFGHTDPRITFSVGGTARITASGTGTQIEILVH